MYRIDNASAATALPAPAAVGPNPNSFFTGGDPATSTNATIVDADWLNAVQEEIIAVLAAASIAPSKTTRGQLLASIVALTRTKLFANLNLYVSATGSDANNGLTVATPWETLQKAWTVVLTSYDLNGYSVIINVADGSYAPVVCQGMPSGAQGGSTIKFQGDTATPGNCTVSATGEGQACFLATGGAQISVAGFKLTSSGATGWGLNGSGAGSQINVVGNMEFSSSTTADVVASNSAVISINSNYGVSGTSGAHWQAFQMGVISVAGSVTLIGSVTFNTAFAHADGPSQIVLAAGVTFTGAATGLRYWATNGGYVATGTGNPSLLPGSSAGNSTSGYYS